MKKIENKTEDKDQERHEKRKHGWLYSGIWATIIFIVFSLMLYTRLPFGSYTTFNLILADKALAATSVVLIGLSFFLGPLARVFKWIIPRLHLRKYFGVSGFGLAAMHAIFALGLFDKDFFIQNQEGFLFGVLAFIAFAAVSVTSIPSVEEKMDPKQWKFVQRVGYLAFIFTLLHFSVMKFQYWTPYFSNMTGLPSTSFVAFAFGIIVLIARLSVIPFNKRNK